MERRLLSALHYILGGLCAVVVLATAYLIGLSNGRTDQQAVAEAAYRQAWDDASSKLLASELLPEEPAQLLVISGIIDEISGDALIVSADEVIINPLAPPGPETRTVILSTDTKIIGRTDKPPEDIVREEEEFIRAQEANLEAAIEPPLPYTETEIEQSELLVGDRVIVEAAEDIKFATEIQATRIVRF